MSLRYDLTAPLARHVAENFNEIQLPFRTYRAGYVFRNEKPGPGRFRQFMQFDADTVGAAGVQADAEMCMMMADTMEALIGATYLSAGPDEATRMVLRLVEPLLADPERYGAAMDPKTSLQEIAARLGLSAPVYRVEATGPDHDRRFIATVTVGDVETTGPGSSKKQAEMAAALTAWRELDARA